jgi:hypothetical protein
MRILASGICPSCNIVVQYLGRTEEEAGMLLHRRHGQQHIFQGKITFERVGAHEIRRIRRNMTP